MKMCIKEIISVKIVKYMANLCVHNNNKYTHITRENAAKITLKLKYDIESGSIKA